MVSMALTINQNKRLKRYEVLLAANVEPEYVVRAEVLGAILRGAYISIIPVIHVIFCVLDFTFKEQTTLFVAAPFGFVAALLVGASMTFLVCLGAGSPVMALIRMVLLALPVALVWAQLVGGSYFSFFIFFPLVFPFLLALRAWTLRGFRKRVLG
jgi:hypothetical protein